MKKQSGFTLIEIAIVMVIIGLLLGGVMKGQELMTNAKVKSLTSDFSIIPAAYFSYVDRFRAVPGDDANVVAHLGATANVGTTTATLGNGVIEGPWNAAATAATATAANETALFWQHIRLANLINGPTALGTGLLQTNAVAGTVGVAGVNTSSGVTNQVGSMFICSNGINGDMVVRLDTLLDDGTFNTGSLVVGPNAGGAMLTAAPTASTNYVACLRQ